MLFYSEAYVSITKQNAIFFPGWKWAEQYSSMHLRNLKMCCSLSLLKNLVSHRKEIFRSSTKNRTACLTISADTLQVIATVNEESQRAQKPTIVQRGFQLRSFLTCKYLIRLVEFGKRIFWMLATLIFWTCCFVYLMQLVINEMLCGFRFGCVKKRCLYS